VTSTLSPDHALAYLALLSTDLRAAAVLDSRGELLAGDGRVAAHARAVLVAGGDADISAPAGDGTLYVSRSEGHAVAVEVGRFALGAVVVDDLRRVLAALDRT